MKIYISADIEGISGVVNAEQALLSGKDYAHARQLMIKEVNAAIEGAFAGGAEQVVVGDSHSHQFNLLAEELHPEALLVTGGQKPMASMMETVDETCDAVFFIGYHAMAGNRLGVLNHTYQAKEAYNVRLNGMGVGELGINAALAGYYNVPVILVTGDKAAAEEAESLLGGEVRTVAVKESRGKYCSVCMHPGRAREMIRAAARNAVMDRSEKTPFVLEKPIVLEIDLADTCMADMAELIPGTDRYDDRSVRFTHEDGLVVHKYFRAALMLAASVRNPTY